MVKINNENNSIYLKKDSILKAGTQDSVPNIVFKKDTLSQSFIEKGLTVETDKIPPKGSTNPEHLKNAPSPIIIIKGEEMFALFVVDTSSNTLYRYDENGKPLIAYSVATGKKYTSTKKGIRQIDHVESYPYKSAYGTKRKKNPKAYGPNVLYLVSIDHKTGNVTGSNGQFIHGNNNEKSLGTHASLGCIRMDNDVIKEIAKEEVDGLYVLIL